tara:strand:+ start:2181 stop:2942 length:762 start_codon:yes stop_codon:yes gene_type:complete
MVEFTISRENFQNFLSSFGKDLADIVIKAKQNGISAAVAQDTHYIRRNMDCGVSQTGNLYITDIPKVKSFLSTTKESDLTINQVSKTGTLHVRCGNSSLQLPTSSYIQSQEKVGLIEKMIKESENSMWKKWANIDLSHHAIITAASLKPATGFKKVLGDKYSCKTDFDMEGKEFVIRGGSSSTGKMFIRAPLKQIDAPNKLARSAYDKWLPELLSNLPNGDLNLYTGNETVLVFLQADTNFLMIIVDQQYEED